jgi:hypothetical protein
MAIQQFPLPEAAGIPSGNTAGRPSSPSVGDQYYNGQTLTLEIFDGTNWQPISPTPGQQTIVATDVGTGVAYGAAQASIAFTSAYTTGNILGYVTYATSGGFTATATSSPVITTVGNNGTWSFNGLAYNNYGQGPLSNAPSVALTTVPQAPTIGTATTSGVTSSVTVTWTLGNNGGKNLSSITITPYLNGTTAQTSQTAVSTSSTSHSFTGLTMGSAYTFKVKTTNANGTGLESNATNSVTIPTIISVNYLVIAGGGAGGGGSNGGDQSGGGGAGGYRTSAGTSGAGSPAESALSLTGGANFTVTVGAGGSGSNPVGNSGSDSFFSNVGSTGGGRGGGQGSNAFDGGSGGGRGSFNTNLAGGAGTANQGTSGGTTNTSNAGGGGGGAANVGGAGAGNTPGNGGNGLDSNITGNLVTRGGGGGASGNLLVGNGGTGGGGGASANTTGTAGTANTGGGGGGARGSSGGSGGSGIVVLRYPSTFTATIGGGLTATTNTSGSDKITTFNAGTGTVSIA